MKRALSCFLLLLTLAACRKAPGLPQGEDRGKGPTFIFRGFEARASHLGERVWEASAKTARVYRKGEEARAEQVTIHYYNQGKIVSIATAKRAVMDLKAYDVDAEGDVVVKGMNGVVLKTPTLHWNNRRQLASSPDRVQLERGGTVLTGKGFRADRDLRDVRILEEVSAEAVSVKSLRREAGSWKKP